MSKRVLANLSDRPITTSEIATLMHESRERVQRMLSRQQDLGKCHGIRNGRYVSWVLGPSDEYLTQAERREFAQSWVDTFVPFRDPWQTAFFGAPA